MIWALMFVVLTSGLVVTHAVYMSAARRDRDASYDRNAVARVLTRSGLSNAIAWFNGQTQRPLTEFDPTNDTASDPPRYDTLDPVVGLVQEVRIRGDLWGRYEVRRREVYDVSTLRGFSRPGSSWDIGVRSYVYRRIDDDSPFDASPNRILAMSNLKSELRSVAMTLPAIAAITASDPATISISDGAVIDGGPLPAIAYTAPSSPLLTIVPSILGSALVSGTPTLTPVAGLSLASQDLFEMTGAELIEFSDIVWRDESDLPPELDGKIIVAPGDVSIPAGGSALKITDSLVVIGGDFTVPSGVKPVSISGVMIVDGDTDIQGSFDLTGSLIMRGVATLGGSGAPIAVSYDATAISRLRDRLSKYRASRETSPASSRGSDSVYDESMGTNDMDQNNIDPSAVIADGVVLGQGITIGAGCQIRRGCVIADGCILLTGVNLDANAVMGPDSRIGLGSVMLAGSSLGAGVIVGSGVTVGVGAEVKAGTSVPDGTMIPDDTSYPP